MHVVTSSCSTGINRSHVEQTCPDKSTELPVHKLPQFTVWVSNRNASCQLWLSHPRDSAFYAISVRRFSHLCTEASSASGPRKAIALVLRLMFMQVELAYSSSRCRCRFTHRGFSPHKFMPMQGVNRVRAGFSPALPTPPRHAGPHRAVHGKF